MPASDASRSSSILVRLAALVVVIAGLRAAGELLLPLLFSVFLAVMTAPSVLWLERRGIRPVLAVVPIAVATLGGLGVFGAVLAASVRGFVAVAPRYRDELERSALAVFDRIGFEMPSQWQQFVHPSDVIDMVGVLADGMVSALSNTALVLLALLFMLIEVAALPRKLVAAFGASRVDLDAFSAMLSDVQRYLAIKTAVSALTGLLVLLLCWAVGIDFPLVWALVAFLLNYIPNVGSVIAAVPACLVALVQPELGWGSATVLAIGYVVINMVVGNVLEPAWMGRQLGMSALVVFLSLVFWGWVWGPVGMLLSVPLTMVVKIMLERSPQTRALAVLLGPATQGVVPPIAAEAPARPDAAPPA